VKRIFAASVVFASLAFSQEASVITHKSVDVNGHRVAEGPDVVQTKSPGSSTSTEIMQSVNGRSVPLERREENVLRDDASGRLVETLVRTYDQAGNPTQPTKQVLEERKQPDGSSTTQIATYRADLNGKMQLIQTSATELRKSGSSETSETLLQRPSVNGSMETVEKAKHRKVQSVRRQLSKRNHHLPKRWERKFRAGRETSDRSLARRSGWLRKMRLAMRLSTAGCSCIARRFRKS